MVRARFGTDGVRGLANDALTPELALALGRATARVLGSPVVIIGRDTRRSGPMLSSALAAGFVSEGVDVIDVDILPTPGIASLCASRGLPGAVVSASHNPFPDNGIKVLGPGGTKLSDEVEAAIESELNALLAEPDAASRPTAEGVGEIKHEPELASAYIEHLLAAVGPRVLQGLRIVVDCANGAATPVAEEVLTSLGAQVVVVAAEPTGTNINEHVGSTHPEMLAGTVRDQRADLGLALDGDADRLVAVDHRGEVLDGDVLLALFARDLKERGELADDTVVVTVMSNLGLHRALAEAGIGVRTVAVGDRNVLQALDAEGLSLGGEQSGHLIFRDRATTGDGLLSGILLADLVARSSRPLAELGADALQLFPQHLVGVEVERLDDFAGSSKIAAAIEAAEAELGESGRILVRLSGTEPLVRVMVEAEDADAARRITDELVAVVLAELGGSVR
jgi:phosphoglucosamine mutase